MVGAMINQREGRFKGSGFRQVANGLAVAPDIPALAEVGLEIDQMGWWGAWVPAETPDEIVSTLNAGSRTLLETDATETFLQSMGGDVWMATRGGRRAHVGIGRTG